MLDKEIAGELINLSVCSSCILLFSDGNNSIDKIVNESRENNEYFIASQLSKEIHKFNKFCKCCLNCLSQDNIFGQCDQIACDLINMKETNDDHNVILKIKIKIELAPIICIFRTLYKAILATKQCRINNFNAFEDVVKAILSKKIVEIAKEKSIDVHIASNNEEADYSINVIGNIENQTIILKQLLDDNFIAKKKKRPRSFAEEQKTVFEISDRDSDIILSNFKDIGENEIAVIQNNLTNLFCDDDIKYQTKFETVVARSTTYILGRYNKYARDIPQSPWVIEDGRKGRNSIEEIIGDAVQNVIQSKICRLHGCGREDIDVRCLGNGRPFVLEVTDCKYEASQENLLKITEFIKNHKGLNMSGDIDISYLSKVNKTVWENMQNIAEEKKKAYCCVVWSDQPISYKMLTDLENMSSSLNGFNVDEEGRRCLEIIQKTPLRVLHRRSLMSRKRFIYDISTVYINPHFFLMKLITSAGAYVKEFVHGDFGRTEPSISSLFNSQSDILQLDVIGLFDNFDGGYNHDLYNFAEIYKDDINKLSWIQLKNKKLIPLRKYNNLI